LQVNDHYGFSAQQRSGADGQVPMQASHRVERVCRTGNIACPDSQAK
jgi:hypothetical protein